MQPELNFCSRLLCEHIESSAVCEDGCEAHQLLSAESEHTAAAGTYSSFMCAGFVRPPVRLTLQFCCPVDISAVCLKLRCGRHVTAGVELLTCRHAVVGAPPSPTASWPPPSSSWQRVASYQRADVSHTQRCGNDNNDDVTFATRSWQLRQNQNNGAICSLSPSGRRHARCLQVHVTRVLGASVVCVRRLAVWARPVHAAHPAYQRALHNKMAAAASPVPSIVDRPAVVRDAAAPANVDADADVPDEMIDPITCELMLLPTVLPSGNTIDRRTLERHVQSLAERGLPPGDPYTGVPFSPTCRPLPDTPLQVRIDQFLYENTAGGGSGCGATSTAGLPVEQRRQLAGAGRVLGSVSITTGVAGGVRRLSGGRTNGLNGVVAAADTASSNERCDEPQRRHPSLHDATTSAEADCDLDACLRSVLPGLVSFLPRAETARGRPTEPASCDQRRRAPLSCAQHGHTPNTPLYRVPCGHGVCRSCLLDDVRHCGDCGALFSSSDVERICR